jgi:DNA modification methylase
MLSYISLMSSQKYQKPFFKTGRGRAYNNSIETFLDSPTGKSLKGKVDLILTSPPYPLVVPKKYGNLQGQEYLEWIQSLSPKFAELLSVIESFVKIIMKIVLVILAAIFFM